jgi:hypothetical protein
LSNLSQGEHAFTHTQSVGFDCLNVVHSGPEA